MTATESSVIRVSGSSLRQSSTTIVAASATARSPVEGHRPRMHAAPEDGRPRADRRCHRSDSPIRSCSRRSGIGDHQFHFPSRAISDGTSSDRTTNASIQDAERRCDADLLDERDRARAERPDRHRQEDRGGRDHRAGALQADRYDSRSPSPLSRASLIRPSRNTP